MFIVYLAQYSSVRSILLFHLGFSPFFFGTKANNRGPPSQASVSSGGGGSSGTAGNVAGKYRKL